MSNEKEVALSRRVIVIGLDSAPPGLLFGRMLEQMPNLTGMVEGGVHGPLRSCDPHHGPRLAGDVHERESRPVGALRLSPPQGHSYTEGWTPNSYSVRLPRVWDVLARHGKRSCLSVCRQAILPNR